MRMDSRYLAGILETFQEYDPEICKVNYEFQRGGNKMLTLRNNREDLERMMSL